jgi:hypothetical protein
VPFPNSPLAVKLILSVTPSGFSISKINSLFTISNLNLSAKSLASVSS